MKLILFFKKGNQLIPIEIKSAQTFQPEFLKKIQFFQKLVGERAPQGYLIYGGDQEQQIHAISVLNFKHAAHSILQKNGGSSQ